MLYEEIVQMIFWKRFQSIGFTRYRFSLFSNLNFTFDQYSGFSWQIVLQNLHFLVLKGIKGLFLMEYKLFDWNFSTVLLKIQAYIDVRENPSTVCLKLYFILRGNKMEFYKEVYTSLW